MRNMRSTLLEAFGLLLALTTAVAAQDYPVKPLRLLIPFPPGGSVDLVGRIVATKLGERLGRQVVADNRAGAGGIIATELAANSPPDGYTLLLLSRHTPSIRGSIISTTIPSGPLRLSPRSATGPACSPCIRRFRPTP